MKSVLMISCVMLGILGCGSQPSAITIEDAEAWIAKNDVELHKIREYPPIVNASRSASYTSGATKLHIIQFNTREDADAWQKQTNSIIPMRCVAIGNCRLIIDDGPESEVALVLKKLGC